MGKTTRRKMLRFLNVVHIVAFNSRYFFGRNPVDNLSELQFESASSDRELMPVKGANTYRSEESVAYGMNQIRILLCNAVDAQLSSYGLSALQWGVLKALFDGRARTPSELYRILLSDSGAMTRQLDFLERRGFLRRVRNESDRRSVYLVLTDTGRITICETLPLIVETHDRQLRGFTQDEVTALKLFMDRMIVNLG
ncbi:MarR family winged helix-turn-helix transcriptional regulator [Paraburkholderia sp. BL25I1N1]|uniref:MarR family winged helix-turn-helix transcriptional regulator n=1 Tax=Paraburkholderia sp. BL25I1N1 TaxID=1938804 RepID=UPI0021591DB7|nr:MarR family transcriptional regulator [Paraburkholderia sp. BL25I1N1]